MRELLEEYEWLYRGVPEESPEVQDVDANGEVRPRRPDQVEEFARYCHSLNEMTDSGYTSWTTDPEIAIDLAQYASEEAGLSGSVVIFRVRISTIDGFRISQGRESEEEYLIQGTVENVMRFEDSEDEYD